MTKENFKIDLLYIILIFPFIRLEGLMNIEIISITYDILKAIITIYLCIDFIFRRTIRLNKFLQYFFLWLFISLISVFINSSDILTFLIRYSSYLSIILIIERALYRNEFKNFINGVSLFFILLLILNVVTTIVYPNGMWIDINEEKSTYYYQSTTVVYLLGKANAVAPITLGLAVFLLYRDYLFHSRIRKGSIILLALNIVVIIIEKSSTGIIGAILILALFMFFKSEKYIKNRSRNKIFLILFIGIFIVSIGVVFFNLQSLFNNLFLLLFGKDATLSNRTNVWKMTFNYIGKNFNLINYLIGIGTVSYSSLFYKGRYSNCHNLYLNEFIVSGVIGFFLYFEMFVITLKRLGECYAYKREESLMILASYLIVCNVMFITEAYLTPIILMFLYIGYVSTFKHDTTNLTKKKETNLI